MSLKYESVPDMISGKDLDYITDMFNWNYNAYKCSLDHLGVANDESVCELLDKASNLYYDNMQELLSILEKGGCNE